MPSRLNKHTAGLHFPKAGRGGRPARRLAAAGLLLLTLAAGCVSTGDLVAGFPGMGDGTPVNNVAEVVATWRSEVLFVPDPTHNGMPSPCLAGRVYLFAADGGTPVTANGDVWVYLYNETAGPVPDDQPPMDVWQFDKDTLNQKLMKSDIIGCGYTLILPWGNYRPEIARVRLKVRYDPPKSLPVYGYSSVVTLNAVQEFRRTAQQGVPGTSRPAVAPASGWSRNGPGAAAQPAAAFNRGPAPGWGPPPAPQPPPQAPPAPQPPPQAPAAPLAWGQRVAPQAAGWGQSPTPPAPGWGQSLAPPQAAPGWGQNSPAPPSPPSLSACQALAHGYSGAPVVVMAPLGQNGVVPPSQPASGYGAVPPGASPVAANPGGAAPQTPGPWGMQPRP
ncbi:MAG TPA: hypothetical protein VFA26_14430 [Gemmataceae bacterium]|nr:hypothetical protein [Gemmataceae bacterium]